MPSPDDPPSSRDDSPREPPRDSSDADGSAPGTDGSPPDAGGSPSDAVESATDVEDPDSGDVDRPRVVEGSAGREVVVPLRLYKTVTVIGTLLAMVGVIGGFALLDSATNRGRAPSDEISLPLALAGLGLILAGALVYVYSTRFRAAGMGRSKAESDQAGDDG